MTAVTSVGNVSQQPRAFLPEQMNEPVAAAQNSKTSAATPSASDHQTALSVFGTAVSESFRGETFGPEDMSRFKAAIEDKLNDPTLSPGQKDALRQIAAEFEASNDVAGSAFESGDWVAFLGNIGSMLKDVPGAENIGASLARLSGLMERSNLAKDGSFDAADIQRLQVRSAALQDSASDHVSALAKGLIDGGRPDESGELINAANFGNLFSSLLDNANDLRA